MKQTLREYLPAFFGEIRELCVLLDCFESELLLLEQALTQQIANQFLYGGSMDEAGVNRWQQALRLELPGMAAEDKLFEIKSRMLEQRPYNRRQVRHMLARLCGEDGFYLYENQAEKTVVVKLALSRKNQYNSVLALLERVLPAHMVILASEYNTYGNLNQSSLTHQQLAVYSHEQIQTEDFI